MFSLKSLKEKLEKEKKSVEEEIKKLAVPPEFGNDTDHGDEEADETEQFGANLGVQQVLRNRLEEINETLQRIEQGKYGVCQRCGQKISWLLLKINPTSRLCRKCKKEIKKK